jgi:hypothetical protein
MEVPYKKIMKYDETIAALISPLSHVSRSVYAPSSFDEPLKEGSGRMFLPKSAIGTIPLTRNQHSHFKSGQYHVFQVHRRASPTPTLRRQI